MKPLHRFTQVSGLHQYPDPAWIESPVDLDPAFIISIEGNYRHAALTDVLVLRGGQVYRYYLTDAREDILAVVNAAREEIPADMVPAWYAVAFRLPKAPPH